MKTKLSIVAAALLLSVVATGTCYAQQTTLAVKIPFAFQAGDHTLPAGEYLVESARTGTKAVQRLRQVDGDAVMVFMTIPVETRNGRPNPKLVFNCYGQTRFLSQIWTGDGEGRCSYSSPIVRSRLQPEKGGAKLRCSCNRQMSDHNSAAMSRRVSILRFAQRLAGTRETSTEARMGSQLLRCGFPFACSDEISQSVAEIRCRDARSSLLVTEFGSGPARTCKSIGEANHEVSNPKK